MFLGGENDLTKFEYFIFIQSENPHFQIWVTRSSPTSCLLMMSGQSKYNGLSCNRSQFPKTFSACCSNFFGGYRKTRWTTYGYSIKSIEELKLLRHLVLQPVTISQDILSLLLKLFWRDGGDRENKVDNIRLWHQSHRRTEAIETLCHFLLSRSLEKVDESIFYFKLLKARVASNFLFS